MACPYVIPSYDAINKFNEFKTTNKIVYRFSWRSICSLIEERKDLYSIQKEEKNENIKEEIIIEEIINNNQDEKIDQKDEEELMI